MNFTSLLVLSFALLFPQISEAAGARGRSTPQRAAKTARGAKLGKASAGHSRRASVGTAALLRKGSKGLPSKPAATESTVRPTPVAAQERVRAQNATLKVNGKLNQRMDRERSTAVSPFSKKARLFLALKNSATAASVGTIVALALDVVVGSDVAPTVFVAALALQTARFALARAIPGLDNAAKVRQNNNFLRALGM